MMPCTNALPFSRYIVFTSFLWSHEHFVSLVASRNSDGRPNALHFSCRGVRRSRAIQQVRRTARLRRADAPVSYKCGLGSSFVVPSRTGRGSLGWARGLPIAV